MDEKADRTRSNGSDVPTDDRKKSGRSACLMGCMIFFGVIVLICAGGVFSLYLIGKGSMEAVTEFEERIVTEYPQGYEPGVLTKSFSQLISGVLTCRITPEEFLAIYYRFFLSMLDGALTPSELQGIVMYIEEASAGELEP
ncbi:MAG: hypothetical protein JW885_14015 [Deltaproteobacteria bacterium]|nr:hypothetical protein [Candidatus Zymogenaceae bacterium]